MLAKELLQATVVKPIVPNAASRDVPTTQPRYETHKYWEVEQKKNCIGLPLFVYSLEVKLAKDFGDAMKDFGSLSFPLGGEFPVIKLDVPYMFLVSGLVGTKELKLTLRHAAAPNVREQFEAALEQYVERQIQQIG